MKRPMTTHAMARDATDDLLLVPLLLAEVPRGRRWRAARSSARSAAPTWRSLDRCGHADRRRPRASLRLAASRALRPGRRRRSGPGAAREAAGDEARAVVGWRGRRASSGVGLLVGGRDRRGSSCFSSRWRSGRLRPSSSKTRPHALRAAPSPQDPPPNPARPISRPRTSRRPRCRRLRRRCRARLRPGIHVTLSSGKSSPAYGHFGTPMAGVEFSAEYHMTGERPIGIHRYITVVKGPEVAGDEPRGDAPRLGHDRRQGPRP